MRHSLVQCWLRSKPVLLVLVCLGLSACAEQAAVPTATPSPTIAVPPTRVAPTPTAPPTATATQPPAPTATSEPNSQEPTATTAPSEPIPTAATTGDAQPTLPPVEFSYLWPTYIPPGMTISPKESRVQQENELARDNTGFFILTFNGLQKKLVLGGGATDVLPLTGETRRLEVKGHEAELITNGQQRQLVFVTSTGSLFVYGSNISEEELLRVAEGLQPIDLEVLRELVG